MSETVTRLLDAAEAKMREAGYHAVSFRDLAADLGIKSASVHYYFPKKEDLGVAVVARYRRHFIDNLSSAVESCDGPNAKLGAIASAFRSALVTSNKICLCGVMGAEAQGLPDAVRAELRQFLVEIADLIEVIYRGTRHPDPNSQALLAVAAFEGAMILAINLGEMSVFDRVASALLEKSLAD